MNKFIELTTSLGRVKIKVDEISTIAEYTGFSKSEQCEVFTRGNSNCSWLVKEDYDVVNRMVNILPNKTVNGPNIDHCDDNYNLQTFNNFQIISDLKDARPEEYGMIFLNPNYKPEKHKEIFDKAITELFSGGSLIPFGYKNGRFNLPINNYPDNYSQALQEYHYYININPIRYEKQYNSFYLYGSKTTYEDYRYSEFLAIFNILHAHLVEKQDLVQILRHFKNCAYIKDWTIIDGEPEHIYIRTFDSPCLTYRSLNVGHLTQMYEDMKKLFVRNNIPNKSNLKPSDYNIAGVMNHMLNYLSPGQSYALGGVYNTTLTEFRIKMNLLFDTNVLPSHEINHACDIWIDVIKRKELT